MYKKIASNTLAQIFSKMITAVISIFLIGILTKYLPIELYGSYNKIYSYLGIFAFLADMGLYTIAIREIAQGKDSKEKIIGNILTLRTILGLGIWIIALVIALFLPGYHDHLTLLAIGIVGAFTLVSLINSSLLALMQSQMKMEFSVISLVAGKLLNISLMAFFIIFLFSKPEQQNFAFLSVFIAGFLGIVCNTGLNYYYARKIAPVRYLCDMTYITHIFRISLPYGIALFLSVVYFKVDIILLSLLETPEKADISIALYGLPMKIIEVLMVLGGFYLNSLLPSLTEKYTQKKYGEVSYILGVSLKILASFGLFIFLLGNLLAPETIAIIATSDYTNPIGQGYNSVQAFRIVLAVLLFYFLSLSFIYILIAAQKQSLLLWVNIIVALLNIIGNIIMIPYFSFIGSAYVTLLSQVALMGITAVLVSRYITIPSLFIKNIGVSILWGTALFTFFYGLSFGKNFGDIMTILVIAPTFFISYVVGEYFFSRHLFQERVV